MTINAPAAILLAFYVCVAEEQGVSRDRLGGTIQTDILKEYIAQKEWCFPIDPAMRLVTDMVEFCSAGAAALAPDLDLRLPHPRGRLDRAAGARVHARGRLRLRAGGDRPRARRGRLRAAPLVLLQRAHRLLRGDRQVPRRAPDLGARDARDLRRTDPASWRMRFHSQTAGVSLTAQQPLNNIVRTALEALSAVLGGTQSLHTNSYDEALALPTEEAVRVALRTQQIIAHETGVTNTIDPLGGSWFVESLTNRMEEAAYDYFAQDRRAGRDGRGGQAELPAARDRGRLVALPDRGGPGPPLRGGREPLRDARRGADRDPEDRPGARAKADGPAGRDTRAGATGPRSSSTSPSSRMRRARVAT